MNRPWYIRGYALGSHKEIFLLVAKTQKTVPRIIFYHRKCLILLPMMHPNRTEAEGSFFFFFFSSLPQSIDKGSAGLLCPGRDEIHPSSSKRGIKQRNKHSVPMMKYLKTGLRRRIFSTASIGQEAACSGPLEHNHMKDI
jgi:hypothetical protein